MDQIMDADFVIDVQKVYKSFKNVNAVDGVDLRITKGQFTALLGPNGAGKTTLVEMIEGIQIPDSGTIFIKGKQWRGNEEELHQIIGLSLQETRFIDKLTVFETLKLFSSFYRLPQPRVEEIIELTGLEEKRKSYIVNLSGGQRQRLALGIALLNKPEILLLDEPTTGLDPTARSEIWSILLKLREKRQTSLILTTHYMEEAEQLCDYIILIDHGHIIRQGTLPQLLHENGTTKKIEFTLGSVPSEVDLQLAETQFNLKWEPGRSSGILQIENKNPEKHLTQFFDFLKQRKLNLQSFECRRITLNDLFLSLTGRQLHE
jgi:ABC-2 type transport system ATP-binding protein